MDNSRAGLLLLFLVMICIGLPGCRLREAVGHGGRTARLEAIAQKYASAGQFMGTVLVAEGPSILVNAAYGTADMDFHIPNAPDTKFRIGSVTKQFTAALVLLLQQDGRLQIEDPISRYLPEAPATWKTITVYELLAHKSGIADFTEDSRFNTWAMAPHARAEVIAFIRDQPLQFNPGTRFSYSNSNYILLGAVIECIARKPFEQFLQERILGPLRMKDSGMDDDRTIVLRHARGYALKDGAFVNARSESMSIPWAAGGMYSTTRDLLCWLQQLFAGGVLPQEALRAMASPGEADYGLGVCITKRKGFRVLWHDGEIEGFDSYLAYIPERRVAVIVLGNVNTDAVESIATQLLDAVLSTN